MVYFNLHERHRYQARFLAFGVLLGGAVSFYMRSRSISLNFITTIMPTAMSMALILSLIVHFVLDTVHPTPEEKAFRLLENWASNVSTSAIPNDYTHDSNLKQEKVGPLSPSHNERTFVAALN
jgi:hypothetical protein